MVVVIWINAIGIEAKAEAFFLLLLRRVSPLLSLIYMACYIRVYASGQMHAIPSLRRDVDVARRCIGMHLPLLALYRDGHFIALLAIFGRALLCCTYFFFLRFLCC